MGIGGEKREIEKKLLKQSEKYCEMYTKNFSLYIFQVGEELAENFVATLNFLGNASMKNISEN